MPSEPQFVVTPVGLKITGRPTYDEWAAYGKWAAERVKTAMWILGDWLVYGENQWPERYAQAESITGLSYSTLTGASWVAKSIPICRRRQTLEWWPHSEVAGLDPPEQDKILDDVEAFVTEHPADDHPRRSEVREWVRVVKRKEVAQSFAEMAGRYRVIYADPPWQYQDNKASSGRGFGKAEDHYPTMPTEDIGSIPLEAHARRNSVLFCWATVPLLPDALQVVKEWGFEYKTNIVWDKEMHVRGSYVSCQHELLLICTRGSCTPDQLTPMLSSVQRVARGDRVHSEKPEEFRDIITRLYTRGPYLEMFARRETDGWTSYGNQIGEAVSISESRPGVGIS